MTTKESPIDVVEKLDAAFNRKDINAVLEFYEDDATVIVEPGKSITGKATLKKFFEAVFKFDGIAKQEKMKTIINGDIALFISKWSLTTKAPDELLVRKEFYATSVFRKNNDGKWRLTIDNSFGPAILESCKT